MKVVSFGEEQTIVCDHACGTMDRYLYRLTSISNILVHIYDRDLLKYHIISIKFFGFFWNLQILLKLYPGSMDKKNR